MRTNADLKTYVRTRLNGRWTRPVLVSGICLSAELIHFVVLMPFALASGPMAAILGTAISFILSLLAYLLTAGEARFHLAFLRGEEPAIIDMFSVLKESPDRFLVLGFVWLLPGLLPSVAELCIPSVFQNPVASICLGAFSLLLSVICHCFLALSLYLLVDDPSLGAGAAMRMSADFMRGRKLRYFSLVLSFAGYYVLGILSLCIGLLFVYPYFHLSTAAFYLDTLVRITQQRQA